MKVKIGNYLVEIMTPSKTKQLIDEEIKPKLQGIYKELNKLRAEIMKLREEIIVRKNG